MKTLLEKLLIAVLIVGILPSLTAFSEQYAKTLPGLFALTGPLSILKIAIPVFGIWIFRNRKKITPKTFLIGGVVFGAFLLFSTISAAQCGWPRPFLRETAVMIFGGIAGLIVATLSDRSRSRVFLGWASIAIVAIFIDLLFPAARDFFYRRVFDPNTRVWDLEEVGGWVLTGVWGRQSLAKLGVWLPWLVLFSMMSETISASKRALYVGAVTVVSLPLLASTSQRAAIVAAICASITWIGREFWRTREKNILTIGLSSLCLGVVLVYTLAPAHIVHSRLTPTLSKSTVIAQAPTLAETAATKNTDFRKRMWKFSINQIAHHPLGNSCIPESEFAESNLFPTHSHQMMLEQFRSRGWGWGLVHFLLWAYIGLLFLRLPGVKGSLLLAGWMGVQVMGIFDHPWFVLNHALVLTTYIGLAFRGTHNDTQ